MPRWRFVSMLVVLLLAAGFVPATAADIATVTTLVAAENPLKPGFLPNLTAAVATTGGQPLPAGTLTITRTTDGETWTKDVTPGDQSLSIWADGGYEYGTYEFVASYEDTEGGSASSAILDIVYTDLDPPQTRIFAADWYLQSNVSITFETEPDATSECRLEGETWAACTSPWTRTLPDGAYRLGVVSTDAAGNRAVYATEDAFKVDTTPPSGTFTIDGGAVWTHDAKVDITVDAQDNLQPVWNVYYSLSPQVNEQGFLDYQPYGSIYKALTVSGSGTFQIDLTNPYIGGTSGDGPRTVYLQFQSGVIGQLSSVVSRSIVLETTVPSVTAPRRGFVVGSTVTKGGRIDLRVPWTGSDTGSGIARYELGERLDGGGWTAVSPTLSNPTATRAVLTRHSYTHRVRGIDKAGNSSPWAAGPIFFIDRHEDLSGDIVYSGVWSTVRGTPFLNGATRKATAAGAKASLIFTGRSIAWVTRKGPDRGKADVYVNGTKVATIDLHAPTYQDRKVAWVGTWTTTASRKVSIKVLGTAGRPRVDVDALITAN